MGFEGRWGGSMGLCGVWGGSNPHPNPEHPPPTPQVLFLGPLMQLCMDCPWRCMEGLRGALGKGGVGGQGGGGGGSIYGAICGLIYRSVPQCVGPCMGHSLGHTPNYVLFYGSARALYPNL